MQKKIWITWEKQRRNGTLSRELGCKIYELDFVGLTALGRYTKSIAVTISTLMAERPDILFVQNPSIALALLAVLYGKINKTTIVVDAHNAGIRPREGKSATLNWLSSWLIANADITIVTNEILAGVVTSKNGNPAIVPDPLPTLQRGQGNLSVAGNKNVFFISSWADDEPYIDVIKAAKLLDPSIRIYISGNSRGKEKAYGDTLPGNVQLTGFLSEAEFDALLHDVDIVMDLTTRSDCLLCGAYESVAAEKPTILSDTPVLRAYFTQGCVYTDNSPSDLANSINYAISNYDELSEKILALKTQLRISWMEYKEGLENKIACLQEAK